MRQAMTDDASSAAVPPDNLTKIQEGPWPWRNLLVIVALISLVSVGWIALKEMGALARAEQWEKHTYQVLLHLEKLMSSLKDAETGQRGYLLTGKEEFLAPYVEAGQEIVQHQDTLVRLTADNASQQRRLAEVAALTQARMKILKQIIDLRRTQGLDAALKVVMVGQSKAIMDTIREHVVAAEAEEQRLLEERSREKMSRVNQTVSALTLAGICGTSVLLAVFLFLQWEIAQRKRFARELQQHRVNLEHLVKARTAALSQSEARLKTLIDHAPAALAMFDRDMRYLAVSRRWLDDYKVGRDIVGKSHYEVFPEVPHGWKEAHRRGLAGEVTHGDAERFERADGSEQWVNWEVQPWYDEAGGVGGIGIFTEDVTQRVQAVAALERSRELLRLITDTAPALIAYVDAEFGYRQVNRTYERWFGTPPQQLFGQTVREVIGDAAWEIVYPRMKRAMAGEPVSYEEELPYRFGGPRWVSVNLTPDRDKEGRVRGLVVLVIDISDRKRAEAGLVEQRQRLEGIVQSAMDAIISVNANQQIVLFNAAAEEMFQCPAHEAIGASIERFLPAHFRATHATHVTRFGETGTTSRAMGRLGAVHGLRANGEEFPIEASISQIETYGEKLYTVILRDISARVAAEAEIRRMNVELEARVAARTSELQEANRELETFAYAVSHDLRAPLRAIAGFTKILGKEYGEQFDDNARQYLDHVIGGAQRMGDLIEGLLQLSRSARGDFVRKRVDLSGMARRILEEHASVERERRVCFEIEEGLEAEADPRMLEALMRNLLNNAWKYTAKKDEGQIRFYSDSACSPPRYCISDNGDGFDMAHANRLFQPFQRLHRQGDFPGIGIGLATVQRIVQRHGGEITAQAKPGEGACFCFTLCKEIASKTLDFDPDTPGPEISAQSHRNTMWSNR